MSIRKSPVQLAAHQRRVRLRVSAAGVTGLLLVGGVVGVAAGGDSAAPDPLRTLPVTVPSEAGEVSPGPLLVEPSEVVPSPVPAASGSARADGSMESVTEQRTGRLDDASSALTFEFVSPDGLVTVQVTSSDARMRARVLVNDREFTLRDGRMLANVAAGGTVRVVIERLSVDLAADVTVTVDRPA